MYVINFIVFTVTRCKLLKILLQHYLFNYFIRHKVSLVRSGINYCYMKLSSSERSPHKELFIFSHKIINDQIEIKADILNGFGFRRSKHLS